MGGSSTFGREVICFTSFDRGIFLISMKFAREQKSHAVSGFANCRGLAFLQQTEALQRTYL
ncbi:hypothetical protein BJF91_02045 [Allorhizobium taibaishanense]|uniref:Uncharacterized protein n=1 Tax=Allorhizobium taibaishanense TaxID=887144 RepID=A0A1Q9A2B2_9HYPH|nr:hypothetical protein BJF91_02045 [Allorhizobium taibaishanense]